MRRDGRKAFVHKNFGTVRALLYITAIPYDERLINKDRLLIIHSLEVN